MTPGYVVLVYWLGWEGRESSPFLPPQAPHLHMYPHETREAAYSDAIARKSSLNVVAIVEGKLIE